MTNQLRNLLLSFILVGNLAGCGALIVGGAAATVGVIHDRRTTGTVIEDQSIEFKIYNKLDQNEEIRSQSHINVTSYNTVVLLTGEVPTAEVLQQIEDIARATEQVKNVHNELTVAPPSSLSSRSNDTWITTRVKSSLIQIQGPPSFDPSHVKVVTEQGTVYLFGLLTPEESEAVVNTVRQVGGVQKVVTLFEIEQIQEQA